MVANHRAHLGTGFNWLGSATVLAKLIDFTTIFVVLLFLTKQQVGVASVVIAIGMIVEAFNGLGTSEALLQARTVTRTQLDTLFWYVMSAAVVVGGATLLASPIVQALYGPSERASFFLAAAVKQLCVGAALIPLALLNRDLQYERIAVVNLCATLAAAATRLCLAALGAGAWALVLGYAASGFYILVGVMFARPFWPKLQCHPATIIPLVRFGTRAAAANVIEQIFKNVDYLLVGWFYGPSTLAIYRIAFDVAMEPAMAVATLVNRTVLPVLARAASAGEQLSPILIWAVRRSLALAAPTMLALILVAAPLTALLHDGKGGTYEAAAAPLRILAATAILRVLAQLLPTVMLVSGRPGLAARLSATIFLCLTVGILAVISVLPAQTGIVGVACIWMAAYVPVHWWGISYLRRYWAVRVRDLVRGVAEPVIGVAAMGATIEILWHALGISSAQVRLGAVCLALFATYAGLFLNARKQPY